MTKKDKSSQQMMPAYEKERMRTIESNAAVLKAKGIKNFANKVLIEKYEKVSKDQLNTSILEEGNADCQREVQEVTQNINFPKGMKEMQKITPKLMAEFLQWKQEERRKPDQEQNQKAHRGLNVQKNQSNFCAPGSIAKNAKMKKIQAMRGQRSSDLHLPEAYPVNCNDSDSSEDVAGSKSRYLKMRKNQVLGGCQSNDMNGMLERSADLPIGDGVDFSEDDDDNRNEVSSAAIVSTADDTLVVSTENAAVTQEKKRRGKTILPNVQTRTMENRDMIILNDKYQPIGPTPQIVSTFSLFLGIVARDSNYAPLNVTSWRKMPTKDKIWANVLKRYIVPEEGKQWVLSSVNAKWRSYKQELKKKYYSSDKSMDEMLAKRPKDIPNEQFTDLLKYFNSEYAKQISEKNKANRAKQGDMHTMGPRSYAMKRHEMQQSDPNKQCPSEAAVYMKSRKRVVGRTYQTQNEETLANIEKMKSAATLEEGSSKTDPYHDIITKKEHNGRLRMHGLGVTKSRFKSKDVNTPFVLPQVFLQSITDQLKKNTEETVKSVLSKIREANPGVDIVIPDFPTNDEDVSTSHANVDMSDQD